MDTTELKIKIGKIRVKALHTNNLYNKYRFHCQANELEKKLFTLDKNKK